MLINSRIFTDKLMIEMGNNPPWKHGALYWPQVIVSDGIVLARKIYQTHQLMVSSDDLNTV